MAHPSVLRHLLAGPLSLRVDLLPAGRPRLLRAELGAHFRRGRAGGHLRRERERGVQRDRHVAVLAHLVRERARGGRGRRALGLPGLAEISNLSLATHGARVRALRAPMLFATSPTYVLCRLEP